MNYYFNKVGEFNEILHGVLQHILKDHNVITCTLISSSIDNGSLDEILDVYDININDDVCSFRVKISKKHNIMIRFLISLKTNDYIIPILSDIVYISDSTVNQIDDRGSYRQLYCYRAFDINNDRLFIKEEYGNTLGSHVYDCSIVLLQYLLQNHSQFLNNNDDNSNVIGVDLGAGCGLIGLLLAKLRICSYAYLTDQLNQLPLIQENINLNHLENCVSSHELDWDNFEQITTFINKYGQPNYIIGSDVLYSENMAISLFNVIKQLALPKKTKILIAQKIRQSHHDSNGVDITTFPCFNFKKVLVDSNVIIWEIYKHE